MKAVLIVEDDPDIQSLIETIFSMDPRFTVTGLAESAEEALVMARAGKPEIIVLDDRLEVHALVHLLERERRLNKAGRDEIGDIDCVALRRRRAGRRFWRRGSLSQGCDWHWYFREVHVQARSEQGVAHFREGQFGGAFPDEAGERVVLTVEDALKHHLHTPVDELALPEGVKSGLGKLLLGDEAECLRGGGRGLAVAQAHGAEELLIDVYARMRVVEAVLIAIGEQTPANADHGSVAE